MRIITGQVIRSTHNKDCENICRVHNNIIGHDSFCNGKGTVKLVPSARDFNKILHAYYCYCLMMCLLHAKVSMFQFINSRYERKQCGASQIISYTQYSIVKCQADVFDFFRTKNFHQIACLCEDDFVSISVVSVSAFSLDNNLHRFLAALPHLCTNIGTREQ